MTKEIELKGTNQVVLVDDEDFEHLCKYKWKLNRNGYPYYMKHKCYEGGTRKSTHVLLHRLLLNYPDDSIDHKDQNKLNATRANLRVATHQQNQQNRGKQRNNTTGYKGVTLHKKAGKYIAHIGVNGKTIYIGLYNCPKVAAEAYNEAALKYHGDFAYLNKF